MIQYLDKTYKYIKQLPNEYWRDFAITAIPNVTGTYRITLEICNTDFGTVLRAAVNISREEYEKVDDWDAYMDYQIVKLCEKMAEILIREASGK
ncbi:hypothetical protein D1872_89730 [compost metagenome]